MRFILHYRGPLKSNGRPDHKHEIRRHFHCQLKTLWSKKPLSEYEEFLLPRKRQGDYSLIRHLKGFVFVPLITEEMNIVAEISVTMLRPESPGNLLTQGGDIDNRVKTLFDALTMPRHENALPSSAPAVDESPLYCLLEDDNLVTSVSVRTEHLLEPVDDVSTVDLVIDVHAYPTRRTVGNTAF